MGPFHSLPSSGLERAACERSCFGRFLNTSAARAKLELGVQRVPKQKLGNE